MMVEIIGGQYDGLRISIPSEMTEIHWEEPRWTGDEWTYDESILYRAPVTPQLKNGRPTGRRVVYYKYRVQMQSSDKII